MRYEAVIRLDTHAAEATLAEMRCQGLKVCLFHYAALVEGYVTAGEMEAAQSLAQRYSELPKAVVLHTIVIQGFARSGQPHKAQLAFDNMLRQRIHPDWAAIEALVGAWRRAGLLDLAKSALLKYWPYVTEVKASSSDSELFTLLNEFRHLRYADQPHLAKLKMCRARFGVRARKRFASLLGQLSRPVK
jgi:pentatricopeptide repeat protein